MRQNLSSARKMFKLEDPVISSYFWAKLLGLSLSKVWRFLRTRRPTKTHWKIVWFFLLLNGSDLAFFLCSLTRQDCSICQREFSKLALKISKNIGLQKLHTFHSATCMKSLRWTNKSGDYFEIEHRHVLYQFENDRNSDNRTVQLKIEYLAHDELLDSKSNYFQSVLFSLLFRAFLFAFNLALWLRL